MRNAFADEITQLAKIDSRVMLLSGDIGNKLFESFKQVDSKRFLNCGIAEGNMMGVAAGLGLSGLRPIVYTITPFTTTRCFEQIRVDVCYQQSPVIIVGTGAGLSYAELGPTHHSLEDFGIMRTLPGMQIIAPCDATELRLAMHSALQSHNPTYIRIGKKGEPTIHLTTPSFSIGKAITIRDGKNILMLVTGTIMSNALVAAEILQSQGLSTQVASIHTIKPFDEKYLNTHINNFDLIVTVEEHGKSGGLGTIVSELLSNQKSHPRHLRIGTPDEFMHEIGSQKYAQKKYGLDPSGIASKILLALKT
jgi:transketolase